MVDNNSIIESDLDDDEDYNPSIHITGTFFKKNNQEQNTIITLKPNETRLNNIKTEKYFSNVNEETIKIALENYEKKNLVKN